MYCNTQSEKKRKSLTISQFESPRRSENTLSKVHIKKIEEADEMWSFVGKKKSILALAYAIDHMTEKVLSYVFGRYTDEILKKLKNLLEPFLVKHFYTDN